MFHLLIKNKSGLTFQKYSLNVFVPKFEKNSSVGRIFIKFLNAMCCELFLDKSFFIESMKGLKNIKVNVKFVCGVLKGEYIEK